MHSHTKWGSIELLSPQSRFTLNEPRCPVDDTKYENIYVYTRDAERDYKNEATTTKIPLINLQTNKLAAWRYCYLHGRHTTYWSVYLCSAHPCPCSTFVAVLSIHFKCTFVLFIASQFTLYTTSGVCVSVCVCLKTARSTQCTANCCELSNTGDMLVDFDSIKFSVQLTLEIRVTNDNNMSATHRNIRSDANGFCVCAWELRARVCSPIGLFPRFLNTHRTGRAFKGVTPHVHVQRATFFIPFHPSTPTVRTSTNRKYFINHIFNARHKAPLRQHAHSVEKPLSLSCLLVNFRIELFNKISKTGY